MPVIEADVVEKEIPVRRASGGAPPCRDAVAIASGAVDGDDIVAGVSGDPFVPNVEARLAIAEEIVAKGDAGDHALLDEDAVASVAGAGVEEGGAFASERIDVGDISNCDAGLHLRLE